MKNTLYIYLIKDVKASLVYLVYFKTQKKLYLLTLKFKYAFTDYFKKI